MRVLRGYIELNTRICGSTRIYAGIVATLVITGISIVSSQIKLLIFSQQFFWDPTNRVLTWPESPSS